MKRTKNRWLAAAAATMSIASVGTGISPALADDPVDDAMSAITVAAPEALANLADVVPDPSNDHAIDTSIAGTDIEVPTDPADGISMAEGDIAITVGLPFASRADDAVAEGAGAVSYDNGNGSVTLPLVRDDGSVQITSVINDVGAPKRFDYALDLPAGGRIERLSGGALALLDAHDQFIGGLAPAWAVDANGKDVPTHYEVTGTVVTQIVAHSSSDAYPIVADPYLGLQMVQSATWTTRDSRGRTLVVTPTGWARSFGGAYLAGVYGWPEVEQRQSSVRGNAQLQWQYICHQQFAFVKATWNLDTWVRRGSYADSVAHKCN